MSSYNMQFLSKQHYTKNKGRAILCSISPGFVFENCVCSENASHDDVFPLINTNNNEIDRHLDSKVFFPQPCFFT